MRYSPLGPPRLVKTGELRSGASPEGAASPPPPGHEPLGHWSVVPGPQDAPFILPWKSSAGAGGRRLLANRQRKGEDTASLPTPKAGSGHKIPHLPWSDPGRGRSTTPQAQGRGDQA